MKLLPLFLLFIVVSCKKNDPVACVNPLDEEYEVNDTVIFLANCSENGFAYSWDFGDGTESEEKNPEHVYSIAGNYEVELQVFSKKNKSFTSDFKTVLVKDRPDSVVITSIILSSFPQFNLGGGDWDFQGLPDIRFQIVDGSVTYLDGVEVGQDQNFDQSYTYYTDFPFTLPYSANYYVNVLDEDGATDELMSVINFNPSLYSLYDETSVQIVDGDCTITLNLQWTY